MTGHMTKHMTRHMTAALSGQCRHRDGRWVSANDMPRTPDGRPLSYVALNGHGSYPRAGFIPRIFLAFNDRTGQGITIAPYSGFTNPRPA